MPELTSTDSFRCNGEVVPEINTQNLKHTLKTDRILHKKCLLDGQMLWLFGRLDKVFTFLISDVVGHVIRTVFFFSITGPQWNV